MTQLAVINAVDLHVFEVCVQDPQTGAPVGLGHVAVRCSVIEPDSHGLQASVRDSGAGTTQFCTQVLDVVTQGPVADHALHALHAPQLYEPVGAGQYALRVCVRCCGCDCVIWPE